MTDKQYLKKLRAGRNAFRKHCRLTAENGKMKKAWKVPGTSEAGHDAMYGYSIERVMDKIAKGEK